jgi:hypothetical protein
MDFKGHVHCVIYNLKAGLTTGPQAMTIALPRCFL